MPARIVASIGSPEEPLSKPISTIRSEHRSNKSISSGVSVFRRRKISTKSSSGPFEKSSVVSMPNDLISCNVSFQSKKTLSPKKSAIGDRFSLDLRIKSTVKYLGIIALFYFPASGSDMPCRVSKWRRRLSSFFPVFRSNLFCLPVGNDPSATYNMLILSNYFVICVSLACPLIR